MDLKRGRGIGRGRVRSMVKATAQSCLCQEEAPRGNQRPPKLQHISAGDDNIFLCQNCNIFLGMKHISLPKLPHISAGDDNIFLRQNCNIFPWMTLYFFAKIATYICRGWQYVFFCQNFTIFLQAMTIYFFAKIALYFYRGKQYISLPKLQHISRDDNIFLKGLTTHVFSFLVLEIYIKEDGKISQCFAINNFFFAGIAYTFTEG